MQQKPPMATRPSLRSSDGTRPRSRSGNGRPPSSPRSSDPSRPSTGRSSAAAAASDKPMPSFLRPTVSSSLHSSSSSSSLASPSSSSSSSKGAASATAKRSADKAPAQPAIAPRPITPKDKAKALAPASSSTSRWSAVSPRQLMQRASNALKATSKSRGKKSKDAASTAAFASGASGGAAKSQTARAQQHVKALRQQPETPTEPSPSVTPVHEEEPVLLEPKDVEQDEQYIATAVDVRDEEEHVNAQQLEGGVEDEAIEEKKTIPDEEAEVVKAAPLEPELQEEKPQSSAVAETEAEVLQNEEDESPAVVVEEVKVEATPPPEGEDEPATSAMEEKAVEETNSKKSQQEDALKPTENSVTSVISEERPNEEISVISEERPNDGGSVISEEPKEEAIVISEEPKEADPAPIQKHEDVAEEAKVEAAGSSASAPTTPLKEAARDDVEAVHRQVSASEPVTPAAQGVSKGKAVIDEQQQQSASAPVTPVNAAKKHGPSKQQATIPEESAMAFTGRKVKTAMEKRPDEEQPKKKEVARSNDVIEEAKSKLMEKRKSKVLALVGAFETVMDSPRAS